MFSNTEWLSNNSHLRMIDHDELNADLISLKLAEATLRDINEKYEITFENALTGISNLAPNGQFLAANDKCCEILGYTKPALLNNSLRELIHPRDLDHVLQFGRNIIKGTFSKQGQKHSLNFTCLKKDGKCISVYATILLLRFPSGRPKYFHVNMVEGKSE